MESQWAAPSGTAQVTQIQRLAQDTSDLSKDNTKTTTNFTIWTYRSILYNRLVMLGPVCEERPRGSM